nr:MAG TPA: hypothetical protein [Caudoviricetes sp.]
MKAPRFVGKHAQHSARGTRARGPPEARPRRHRQVPERGEKRLRKECPAETLPREGPRRSSLSRLPPPSAAANRRDRPWKSPVRWEPPLRDRTAYGEPAGDVRGKLRHSIRPDV